MEINELRIGNWIDYYYPDDKDDDVIDRHYQQIDEDFMEVLLAARNYSSCYPIPLTPEILEKAGFGIKEPSGTFAWKFSPAGDVLNVSCQYVHQLQNLYFALTGNELNVEL